MQDFLVTSIASNCIFFDKRIFYFYCIINALINHIITGEGGGGGGGGEKPMVKNGEFPNLFTRIPIK